MKVLLISGSAARNSHTLALLGHLGGLLKERADEVVLWDLRERPLPSADPAHYFSAAPHPDAAARDFIGAVAAADAVVLATPTHHGSYSGLLKNALDLLRHDAFRNKPVGLAANAGGARGCLSACEHLRSVVRAMSGYALQIQVGTCDQDYADEGGRRSLAAEPIRARCAAFTAELAGLAGALRTLA